MDVRLVGVEGDGVDVLAEAIAAHWLRISKVTWVQKMCGFGSLKKTKDVPTVTEI